MQAAETVKSRRRSSAAAATATVGTGSGNFALPPPPTRSRKIIQMKPPVEEVPDDNGASTTNTTAKGKASKASIQQTTKGAASTAKASGPGEVPQSQGGKKKQPSATSAAGRKIARKTAHSLIERRRRSKMNEEFALLKSMIPACTGEMHKLAILQASIEYVRYLEDCVSKLQVQHENDQTRAQLPSIREFHPTFREDDTADVEMTDSDAVSPTFTAQPDHSHPAHLRHPSASPALHPQDARGRQHSYSSVSTAEHQRHYSYSTASGATSPAFGPTQGIGYAPSNAGSALTSPALNPQSDLDQEATAALLMLNNDRRGYTTDGRRTVSVRDLLTP
ncbi:uncharacterized protein J7T54_000065 [Emericellopsis cladophorae]|uniref:BHLH domain-containing protein n=1 Tax=Emericellopsis cladophorae TaxID=2686198 RepID=A0A9P9XYD9_9HYPO|nr:uncharacterized protein J7T54_000065 [Emericellopsis cladophorae]KAI6780159.1 hypothetical protein J7T54_000065 [Emericellopsis cladophorae]